MTRRGYWMCPNCELAIPDSQDKCGGCGAQQSADRGSLSISELHGFNRDAAFYKERGTDPDYTPPTKRKRR